MKHSISNFLISILIFASVSVTANDQIPDSINEKIESLASLLKDPNAKEVSRHVARYATETGKNLAIVDFTVEGFGGGNGSSQYLAVFIETYNIYPNKSKQATYTLIDYIEIGKRGWRYIDEESFKFGFDTKNDILRINFKFHSYGDSDPLCCPSIQGSGNYDLKIDLGQRFIESDN